MVPAFLTGCSERRRLNKHIKKGGIYVQTNQLTRAAAEYEKAVELDPDNVDARYQLGAVLSAQNDHRGALNQFARVVELDPNYRNAYDGMGKTYVAQRDFSALSELAATMLESGRFVGLADNFRGIAAQADGNTAAAIEAFSKATAEAPQLVEAWVNLASTHYQAGDYATAETVCRTAVESIGRHDHVLQMMLSEALERQGKFDDAISVLVEDIDLYPGQTESRIRLGELYLRANRLGDLRELATAILERDSRSPFGQYFLGVADLSEGNYAQSVERLSAAVMTAPDLAGPYLYLALAQEKVGSIQQSITHARQYLSAMPDSVNARVLLARLYSKAGWMDDANEMVKQASMLEPDNTELLALRGAIALGEKDYDTAQEEFEDLLEEAPDSIRAKLSLALVALGKGGIDDAISYASGVIETDPADPRAYNVLGLAYLRKGNVSGAMAEFVKARELRPDFLAARRNLARMYAGLGQYDAAEVEYREVLRTRPNDPTTRMTFGYLMMARRDYSSAADAFRTVLASQPEDVRARVALASALARSGESDEAVRLLSERLNVSSEAARLYRAIGRIEFRRGAYRNAATAYGHAAESDPEALGAYIDRGLALMMAGRADKGAEVIGDVRGKFPASSTIILYEVAVRLMAGQIDQAVQLINDSKNVAAGAVVGLDTLVPIVYLAAGDVAAARESARQVASSSSRTDLLELIARCETMSRYPVTRLPATLVLLARDWSQAALEMATGAVDQMPDVCLPYLLRASAGLRLNRVQAVLDDFLTVLSLRPGYPAVVCETVYAYVRLGQYETAIQLLEKAVAAEPDNAQWLQMLGELYMQTGGNEQAVPLLEHALDIEPDNTRAANNLAYVYLTDNRRLPDALTLAEQAASARPADGNILDTLGWAYLKNGRPDEAARTLEIATLLAPTNPTVLYHFGEALHKTGHTERAEQVWREALELGKEFAEAETLREALAAQF